MDGFGRGYQFASRTGLGDGMCYQSTTVIRIVTSWHSALVGPKSKVGKRDLDYRSDSYQHVPHASPIERRRVKPISAGLADIKVDGGTLADLVVLRLPFFIITSHERDERSKTGGSDQT